MTPNGRIRPILACFQVGEVNQSFRLCDGYVKPISNMVAIKMALNRCGVYGLNMKKNAVSILPHEAIGNETASWVKDTCGKALICFELPDILRHKSLQVLQNVWALKLQASLLTQIDALFMR